MLCVVLDVIFNRGKRVFEKVGQLYLHTYRTFSGIHPFAALYLHIAPEENCQHLSDFGK